MNPNSKIDDSTSFISVFKNKRKPQEQLIKPIKQSQQFRQQPRLSMPQTIDIEPFRSHEDWTEENICKVKKAIKDGTIDTHEKLRSIIGNQSKKMKRLENGSLEKMFIFTVLIDEKGNYKINDADYDNFFDEHSRFLKKFFKGSELISGTGVSKKINSTFVQYKSLPYDKDELKLLKWFNIDNPVFEEKNFNKKNGSTDNTHYKQNDETRNRLKTSVSTFIYSKGTPFDNFKKKITTYFKGKAKYDHFVELYQTKYPILSKEEAGQLFFSELENAFDLIKKENELFLFFLDTYPTKKTMCVFNDKTCEGSLENHSTVENTFKKTYEDILSFKTKLGELSREASKYQKYIKYSNSKGIEQEQVFYNKYIKYKTKYQILKNQIAGSELDGLIQTIELDNLHFVRDQVVQQLQKIIPQDRFLSLDEIKSLIESIGLEKIIQYVGIYYMYHKDKTYSKVLNIHTNPNNFFSELAYLFQATKNILVNLTKYIESNVHTVLLIPGDSPSYFLFMLEILYPELKSNPKVTIVSFPISGLSADNIIEFFYNKDGVLSDYKVNADGKPYLNWILKANLPEAIQSTPHQFVIIDYLHAGKSAVFIEHTIKELYETKPYRLDENFIRVINLNYYFQPSSEIEGYLSELKDLKKKIKKLKKSHPEYFSGLDGVKKLEKFLFANWYLYLYPDFLKGLANIPSDKTKVLGYLVDESDRRCQYKIKLPEAIELAAESSTMIEFLSKIPKPDNVHLNCNLFNILLYLIYTQLPLLNLKSGELFKKISTRVFSLIPRDIPVKFVVEDKEIPWNFKADSSDTQIILGPKNIIGLLDISSIKIL